MNKSSFLGFIAVVVCIITFCWLFGDLKTESACIKSGCSNRKASGSLYCYVHKPSTSYSSKRRSSSGASSTGSSSGSTSSSYRSKSKSTTSGSSSYSSKKKSFGSSRKYKTQDSYDEGYDDIYLDDDYDSDRYDTDSDYADGVDDAMDEFEEDW